MRSVNFSPWLGRNNGFLERGNERNVLQLLNPIVCIFLVFYWPSTEHQCHE
jgi:hypothetical protein